MTTVEPFVELVCQPVQVFRGRLELDPVPASRPRITKNGTYTPAAYKQFKKQLTFLLKTLRIPAADWTDLDVTFWFPFPKHTPRKYLVHGARHRKKPDSDNLLKGMMDALTAAKVLRDDGQLSDTPPRKRYCLAKQGYITFQLTARP